MGITGSPGQMGVNVSLTNRSTRTTKTRRSLKKKMTTTKRDKFLTFFFFKSWMVPDVKHEDTAMW